MSETEFLISYDVDVRLRHTHLTIHGRVVDFVVQLEIRVDDHWVPVIRYDTVHGFAHRDILHPDGSVTKTPLFVGNYGEALTYAEGDLKSNWDLYRERFLREMRVR